MDGQRRRPGGVGAKGGHGDEPGGMEWPQNGPVAPGSCSRRLFPPPSCTGNLTWHTGIKVRVRNRCPGGKRELLPVPGLPGPHRQDARGSRVCFHPRHP